MYLRLFKVFNRSGKCPLWDASSQGNICRAFFWSGECPSGTFRDVSGQVNVCWGSVRRGRVCRGNVRWGFAWSGKCLSEICLVSEVSVGDVSGRERVHRECVWSGKSLSGKSPLGKCQSGMCPGILWFTLYLTLTMKSICQQFRSKHFLSWVNPTCIYIIQDFVFNIFNKYAPIKRKYVRANKAPFLTKELHRTIMKSSRLRNKLLKDRTENNQKNFKQQWIFVKNCWEIQKNYTTVIWI